MRMKNTAELTDQEIDALPDYYSREERQLLKKLNNLPDQKKHALWEVEKRFMEEVVKTDCWSIGVMSRVNHFLDPKEARARIRQEFGVTISAEVLEGSIFEVFLRLLTYGTKRV